MFSVIEEATGNILDQLSIGLNLLKTQLDGRDEILALEESLRTTLLKIMLLGKVWGSQSFHSPN